MPLLTTYHGSSLALLSLSLMALIILRRGAKNTQSVALLQILIITGLMMFRASSQGTLLDVSHMIFNPSTMPGLIIQFILVGIAFIVYFQKRPLR